MTTHHHTPDHAPRHSPDSTQPGRVDAPTPSPDHTLHAFLADQLTIPVGTGPQAQGDVLILPWPATTAPTARAAATAAATPIPAHGLTVHTTPGGHPHTLHTTPTPPAQWAPTPTRPGTGTPQTFGVLIVPPTGWAVLGHHEHPDHHIGPGTYALRGQHTQPLPTTTRPTPDPDPALVTD